VMNEAMECPRCKLIIEETLRDREQEPQALIEEIEAFLQAMRVSLRMTEASSLRFERGRMGAGLIRVWVVLFISRRRQSARDSAQWIEGLLSHRKGRA